MAKHLPKRLALLLPAALWGCDLPAARGEPARAEVAQQRRAYACAASIAPDQAAADAEIRTSYADWKRRYVTPRGAGGLLRVTMAQKGGDRTSSEGIGYGMLLAAYLNDRPTFDALWGYAKRHRNPRGLMAWNVSPQGRVLDPNAATDGDADMAFALVVADARWRAYGADARALIRSLRTHTIEPGTYVVKPGDVWGGSNVMNPSYFSPAYYRVFAAYTGDASWNRVIDANYAILARVNAKHSRGTGLQPELATIDGDSSTAEGNFEFHYGYNATRVPWRLAKDAAWNCDRRARGHLDQLNAFFRRVGASAIRDGYTLQGRPTERWHTAAFVGPAMAGAIVAPDARFRAQMWNETLRLRGEGYYHDSLRLLAILFASGNMQPPPARR
jgi:endo-1,4-beta-D-glucanase Y